MHNAELQLKRTDSGKIDVMLNVRAASDPQGNVLYSRSALRANTERNRTDEWLRENEDN